MDRYFIRIKAVRQGQIKGTANLRGSNDWIEGVKFSMDVIAPHDPGTGQLAGKTQFQPVLISKKWDAASPQLLQAFSTHEQLSELILEFVEKSTTGVETPSQRITLSNASIINIKRYVDYTGPAGARPLEEISFVWQKMTVNDVVGNTSFSTSWSSPP